MTERNLSVFLQEIKSRNTDISSSTLAQCQKDLSFLQKKIKARINDAATQQSCNEEILKWYTQNQKLKLKSLKNYSENQTDDYLLEIMYIIIMGVFVTFDKKIPRTTQLICFWLNLHSSKTILQVKTGEGKTMIVAMTALYYAIRGKKVDVFTSSEALATTETSKSSSVRKLYQLFGISLDENCSIKIDQTQAAKVYNSQIIYGTAFQFQGDYLRKIFSGKIEFFKDRQFDENHVAILDEVDALLIDKMKDSTRLSSQKPLYETIKTLFVLIYEVKTKLMNARQKFGGTLEITILNRKVQNFNVQNTIPTTSSTNQQSVNQYQQKLEQQICQIVSYALSNDLKDMFPSYLLQESGYIAHMLKTWIKNSFVSNTYEENVHYIVSRDGSMVIPIDKSTGTYQKNTKWSDGIHQFIELRHGIEPSVDSLVTNYESNLIFFQRYSHYLYGMTGTIASSLNNKKLQQESVFEKFLKESYKLKIFKISTFKKRLLFTEYPKMMYSQHEWMKVLIKHAKKYSENRMTLLIFETIKEAKTFIQFFKQSNLQNVQYSIVQLYDHDDYHQTMKKKMDIEKTIIVSTNLGGRGTDYEIKNQNILKSGGLFVMMTYFPQNWRIEEQAFGRAARNGQPGSGAFYINMENYFSKNFGTIYQRQESCLQVFALLTKTRQEMELQRFKKATEARVIQQQKKELLDKFRESYITKKLQRLQQVKSIIEKEKRIIQNCSSSLVQMYELQMEIGLAEEQWGLFLKQKIGQNPDKQLKIQFQDFYTHYSKNRNSDNVNPGILTSTASKILNIEQYTKTLNGSCRSYELFKKAQQKNREWVSKYYLTFFKLKMKEGNIVTKSFYQQLNRDLREIANLMIVDLSIYLAMIGHFQNREDDPSHRQTEAQKISNQQLIQTEKFFLQEITKLQTIAKTLEQYTVRQGRNMLYQCKLEQSNHSVSKLHVLGFDNVFTVTIFEKPPPEKKPKKGFWASLWDGICSVVKTVVLAAVSVVSTVVAAVATPLLYVFGGSSSVGKVWQGVGKLWKKTGKEVENVIKNPAFQYLGGILTTFILSGSVIASAAWATISYWIFFGGFETVDSSAIKRDNIEDKAVEKTLIKISGTSILSEQASKKIKEMHDKMNHKKKLIDQELQQKLAQLDEVRAMKFSDKKLQQVRKFTIEAFSTKKNVQKLSQLEINKIINESTQIKDSIASIVHKKVNAKKYGQKIQQVQNQLIDSSNKSIQNTQTELNKQLNTIVEKVKQNAQKEIKELSSLKPTTNEEVKKLNQKIETFNKKSQFIKNKLTQVTTNINEKVTESISEVKLLQVENLCLNLDDLKISKQDQKIVKTSLKNLAKPVQEYVEAQTQLKQILDTWKNEVIDSKVLQINTQKLKSPLLKEAVQEFQDDVYNQMKEKIIQKHDQDQQELQKQTQKEQGDLIVNVLKQSKEQVHKAMVTPIHNPSQINDFSYYSRVIQDQCLHNKIPAFASFQKIDDLQSYLMKNSKNEQQTLLVMKEACIFKVGDKSVCKIYEKNQATTQLLKIISPLLKCSTVEEKSNLSSPGWSMVTDIKKFIENSKFDDFLKLDNFGIDSSSMPFNMEDIRKQYMESMFLEATHIVLEQMHPKIIQQRKSKGSGSLPLTFLPFQLLNQGKSTLEFKQVENQIKNKIMEQLFKKNSDYERYKYLTVAVNQKFITEQKEKINQDYEDYVKFLKPQKAKRVR